MLDGNIAKLNVVKNREIASEIIYCETRKNDPATIHWFFTEYQSDDFTSVDGQISKAGYGEPRRGMYMTTSDLLVRRR